MDDRNQEVFRRYDIRVYTTYKARGAVVLETDHGLLLLKNFEGSTARVEFENAAKEFLIQQGYPNVDLYLRNVDGDLITEDFMGNKYVLKNWFVGEECNLKETSDIISATSNLAFMHSLMVDMVIDDELKQKNLQPSLFDLFEKRNRELKRYFYRTDGRSRIFRKYGLPIRRNHGAWPVRQFSYYNVLKIFLIVFSVRGKTPSP